MSRHAPLARRELFRVVLEPVAVYALYLRAHLPSVVLVCLMPKRSVCALIIFRLLSLAQPIFRMGALNFSSPSSDVLRHVLTDEYARLQRTLGRNGGKEVRSQTERTIEFKYG